MAGLQDEKRRLGSGCLGMDAIPQSAQGVQGIVQNYVFFNVIRGSDKQFFDPVKDGLSPPAQSTGELVSIGLKQRSVIENMPGKRGGGAGRTSTHNSDPWIWLRRFQVAVWRPAGEYDNTNTVERNREDIR